jgi:hypothetical protein
MQMETAKVDIRKLQLLNDRINQCLDALNQVRLSVHGLSQGLAHSSPQAGIGSGATPGLGPTGFGANAFSQTGVNPYVQTPFSPGFTPGLSHTSGFSPFSQGINPFGQGMNPYLSSVSPESLEGSVRPIWADPILTARITQTFPYAQFPVPPVVTIY